eukprot:TRINITY_DN112771_c0_g1_i1.p2 TRINITY_DN112771_c0_g1~~TRINITY_DN112771_c0_g1_i1.p2  ORF type:complete len:113 (+),score=15.88 TRINITY_DN112771_c0_g1_i1:165-503(+)
MVSSAAGSMRRSNNTKNTSKPDSSMPASKMASTIHSTLFPNTPPPTIVKNNLNWPGFPCAVTDFALAMAALIVNLYMHLRTNCATRSTLGLVRNAIGVRCKSIDEQNTCEIV